MKFRSKTQSRAVATIEYLTSKHKTLDIVVTDNILDSNYFEDFLPALAACDWDLRMQYEIKANLKKSQIELMYAAGIRHVQPGIESLSSNVLRLMRKGITGPRNIQALRDLEAAGLTVSWNYLVGFPGETDEDYERIIAQIPFLYHLQPPRAGATRVSIQRFSPFFNDPALGFSTKAPHAAYPLIYDLAPRELEEVAFFFEVSPHGIEQVLVDRLQAAIDEWSAAYDNGSQLLFVDSQEGIEVLDGRAPNSLGRILLRNSIERNLFYALRNVVSRDGVCEVVARNAGCDPSEAQECLRRFVEHGWTFENEGLLVGLPIEMKAGQSLFSADTNAARARVTACA